MDHLSVTTRPPFAPHIEFVERKGVGHPDTICDALAEGLARELATEYLAHTGEVQHFNVDKAILAAGSVDIDFGGGRHVKPSRLVLVGKADMTTAWGPDPDELAKEYKERLLGILPDADPDAFSVELWLNQSAVDLAAVVKAGHGTNAPLANDTSFAAVSLPRSPLETAVHDLEAYLNSDRYRARVPIGRDIKIMGSRIGDGVTITIAVPVLARDVGSAHEYDAVIEQVKEDAFAFVSEIVRHPVTIQVNQADQDGSAYLTLSGTSAEAGDDGQVGRGNRFGGLITPYRPMSLEAAAGKNPAAHVGKTYHAIGQDIATRLLAETAATEATVRLLSAIGHPVTEPQVAHVEIVGDVPDSSVAAIVAECFDDWKGVRDRLIAGEYELY